MEEEEELIDYSFDPYNGDNIYDVPLGKKKEDVREGVEIGICYYEGNLSK